VLVNNVVLLVILNKFEPNRMLANVNKFKPYKYVDQVVSKPIVNQTTQKYVEIIMPQTQHWRLNQYIEMSIKQSPLWKSK